MTSIFINNLGKKFNREWVFRKLNFQINAGDKVVILGGNGSGKSTLLQVISGYVTPNEGEVTYSNYGLKIKDEKIKDCISFASPYLQLIEEFTLEEMIQHVSGFKPFINSLVTEQVTDILELGSAKHKFIKQFSSGMKQRLKLGLAILADTPVLLLDEPASNLDKSALTWYGSMIENYGKNKTVIVCSNAINEEYFFCSKQLNVVDYKSTSK